MAGRKAFKADVNVDGSGSLGLGVWAASSATAALSEVKGFEGTGDAVSNRREALTLDKGIPNEGKIEHTMQLCRELYATGQYSEALRSAEMVYEADAFRPENLLMLGAIHFQLRNFSESIFYNQQCIRVDPACAESYNNLGNALRELGDLPAAIQFYLKVWIYVLITHCIQSNANYSCFISR